MAIEDIYWVTYTNECCWQIYHSENCNGLHKASISLSRLCYCQAASRYVFIKPCIFPADIIEVLQQRILAINKRR